MPKENLESEDQSDFDTEAALADISSELFGQGGDEEGSSEEKSTEGEQVEKPAVVAAVESEAAPPIENSEEVKALGAPETWSKEAIAEWATLPPRAQQEILKREDDMFRGLAQYKEKADLGTKYDQVVEPYRPVLAAENIDPVQLFQSFAANHYILSRGSEAQKLELASNMIQGYGIDFAKLVDFLGDRVTEPQDPRMAALERELAELKGGFTARQQQDREVVQVQLGKEIEVFSADPAHPYFEELASDIAKLFETNQASSLQEAYDKAVYLNPTTRMKEIDRLTAERTNDLTSAEQARKAKIAAATAADISLTSKPRDGTVPVGSIDDTLAETMAAINSRG